MNKAPRGLSSDHQDPNSLGAGPPQSGARAHLPASRLLHLLLGTSPTPSHLRVLPSGGRPNHDRPSRTDMVILRHAKGQWLFCRICIFYLAGITLLIIAGVSGISSSLRPCQAGVELEEHMPGLETTTSSQVPVAWARPALSLGPRRPQPAPTLGAVG